MAPDFTGSTTRPSFPAYLLPSLSFPLPPSFRRRPSNYSAKSISSSSETSSDGLSSSITPVSSANTTPSSSPPDFNYFTRRFSALSVHTSSVLAKDKEVDQEVLQDIDESERGHTRLTKAGADTLKCSSCATDVAFADQIVSKGFTGRHGRAYLVSPPTTSPTSKTEDIDKIRLGNLVNTQVGKPENRQLVTGAHVVADIKCTVCHTVLGWKYVDAKDPGQKYKIGKFILETKRVVMGHCWEDEIVSKGQDGEYVESGIDEEESDGDEVHFDSEDEDECDDLFSGTWDRHTAAKRRIRRVRQRRQGQIVV